MNEFEAAVAAARPAALASDQARSCARDAAVRALDARARRTRMVRYAMAALTVGGLAAVVATAFVATSHGPRNSSTPGPAAERHGPPTTRVNHGQRSGVAAVLVFRPAVGLTLDEAFEGLERVVHARAKAQDKTVDIARTDRDRVRVTVYGASSSLDVESLIAGSAVAAYDLDAVLVGTFTNLRMALRRARQLAPDAPASMAWFVRRGGAIRGPAPRAADLPRTTAPDAEILELPEGYTVLRRQYLRNARGDAVRLQPPDYYLVRDQPALRPLDVTGSSQPIADTSLPGAPVTLHLRLSEAGRSDWDELLSRVSARAAADGQPQHIVVTVNGAIWQTVTADASGKLDTRPGSPALEFGSFMSGSGIGFALRSPVANDEPHSGSLPAVVWVDELFHVGASPSVLGERVTPLPAQVRRSVAGFGLNRGDLTTVRRALVVAGVDGNWAVWNYLTASGDRMTLVTGPRPSDGFGFTCPKQRTAIRDCGGGKGFQVFGVPAAATRLRFQTPTGLRTADAANGWAVLLGPRRHGGQPPASKIRAETLDARGKVIATAAERFALP